VFEDLDPSTNRKKIAERSKVSCGVVALTDDQKQLFFHASSRYLGRRRKEGTAQLPTASQTWGLRYRLSKR
jgi:hypothetical protein